MGLDFSCRTADGLTTCRFITSFGEGVIDRHWPGLYESWDGWERDRNPFFRFAVNNNNQEEMAVYLGLSWALTDLPVRLGVLHYQWYTLRTWYHRDPDAWAAWEFLVDAESRAPEREEGFKRARSGRPPPGVVGRDGDRYGSGAGMYDLVTPDDLRDLTLGALSDAWGEVTVFGLADQSRREEVIEALSGKRPPHLDSLLHENDRMVHLAFGVDLGYYDSILVVGRGIEVEVQRLAEQYTRAATAYQVAIPSIRSMNDVLAALGRLQAGEG